MSADTPAPHTPSDDPRVRELHHALCAAWAKPTPSTRPTDDEARDLLARLDAAAPAADLTALPAADAWVDAQDSDDQTTHVPTWHLDTLLPGRAIAAWVNGVDIDSDLLKDVEAVERDALRVLAAVHAHRRYAGRDAGLSKTDTCPGCGRDTTRAVDGRPDFIECATCGDSWVRPGIDPAIHDALEAAWTLVGQWKAAAVARGCEGLPDAGVRYVDPTEVEAGEVARWDVGPCMVFAERYWGRPRVSLAVQAPAELRDPCGLARALEAAAAWLEADSRTSDGSDAAVPARDDALARWLDGEIADSERIEAEALDEGDQWLADGHDQRARTLREVRDRLGATTNTTPEEG